ncbi:Tetratricopeptide-like helical [Penicillium cf. griseofulvum]|uniref:Tetratricopeptide-like helical n=1 Tax=Penicillium cf. griseofulvum TaxID=2972120 RepID=A0A9W9JKZ0_9EURO|nr:Tetratricopeptide-like helical [Penicillium cf. griseofulvum]KAJ5442771.1 Tetratricopeptide-like helical [Penicillium cf. griseofulvum]KAJ5451425.1 Tetratricopeptide-like helical [Penicillium cf. griseofulvum]
MAGGNAEKGQGYIAALDQARSQGKWDELPELIRKVTKHAPQKTCLIQTATAESRVIAYLQQKSSGDSSSSSPNLVELIPALLMTIESHDGSPQELLQAQVCLGWIHWALNEPGLSAARLPKDFAATVDSLASGGEQPTSWTEVCLVKGCYIKATAQFTAADIDDALETFSSLIPWLSGGKLASITTPQFLNWSESLLGNGALLASDKVTKHAQYSDPRHADIALRLLRLWASHPAVKQGVSASNPSNVDGFGPAPRASVWTAYYRLLTAVLQNGVTYTGPNDGPDRPQLSSELRRVETIYERNLLSEVKFPTASSQNSQVEEWVEQVISNWQVLCGPEWQDSDLGEGGQNAVGRNVLEILYRAATKTYHSHLVLRRLFHVHSALADFDLAVKALDSYIEIVTAAKERAEKSAAYGELEKDEVLLQTLSEGVTLLSCLGSFEEAEKARDLTEMIREYIDKNDTPLTNGQVNGNSTNLPKVLPSVLASSYRAIGVGLACWASWTPVTESRDEIRADAIEYLEKSLAPELGSSSSYSSIYTLGLVLAENRDLDTAIDYVKSALTPSILSTAVSDDLSKERDLVSLWHLLALLLSAKQEFEIAGRSCEAAFEQFPRELFSKGHRERSSSRNAQTSNQRSIISRLQGREKERIVQTRITQLAFIELLEGPEAAVNHSTQLLSLFSTLFQDLNLETGGTKAEADHLVPPKSSAGTTRSFRGSIFGRNRTSQLPDRRADQGNGSDAAIPPTPAIPNGHMTDHPSIQVTDEDPHSRQGRPPTIGRTDSKKLKKRSSSFHRNERPRVEEPPLPNNGGETPAEMVGIAFSGNTSPESALHPIKGRQPLPKMAHNMNYKQEVSSAGHEEQPPKQDIRLPIGHRFDSPTSAVTKFSLIQSQKHALSLLVKIWLVIAGLYRRASLFDDAREACEEASKQAARVEALVASHESSARSFSKRGWGASKSSEELWADVHAEQGLLSQARSSPHQAIRHFEEALLRYQDHPAATIGLASLLLDIWEQKLDPEPSNADVDLNASRLSLLSETPKPNSAKAISTDDLKASIEPKKAVPEEAPLSAQDVGPKHLHRLAARDRAYGLLSALTKLGSSWDNSEAWYALSRAYEAGEQVEKLKEVLWWCIELEDRRPIRHWSNIGSGVYVL